MVNSESAAVRFFSADNPFVEAAGNAGSTFWNLSNRFRKVAEKLSTSGRFGGSAVNRPALQDGGPKGEAHHSPESSC
jgi:hypothetical protein